MRYLLTDVKVILTENPSSTLYHKITEATHLKGDALWKERY